MKLQARTFVGLDGRTVTQMVRQFKAGADTWTVYEDKEGPSLVFEMDRTARRVRHYPPNWAELPDEELYALSWGR